MTPEQFIRTEQEMLWSRLDNAIRAAYNGSWSLGCTDLADSLLSAAAIVGLTPWSDVPWRLSTGGVYEALYRHAGIEPPMPTAEEYAASVQRMTAAGYPPADKADWVNTIRSIERNVKKEPA